MINVIIGIVAYAMLVIILFMAYSSVPTFIMDYLDNKKDKDMDNWRIAVYTICIIASAITSYNILK